MKDFEVGKYINELRKKYTPTEIAYKLGMTESSISRWSSGKVKPKSKLVIDTIKDLYDKVKKS